MSAAEGYDEELAPLPPVRVRGRRTRRTVQKRSENIKRLSKRQFALGQTVQSHPEQAARPRTWGECIAAGRGTETPCALVACAYHLALDVDAETGTITLRDPGVVRDGDADGVPEIDVRAMRATCALAEAARGGITLEDVGAMLNLTRERIRQVETKALREARRHLPVLPSDARPSREPWQWTGRTADDIETWEGP